MSDANVEALKEWVNRVVPKDFSPGYVVLSYIISYIGAWTTLELINRRTAGKGLYNW
jgi:NO-binding membrane sensor protein with MHYT domain